MVKSCIDSGIRSYAGQIFEALRGEEEAIDALVEHTLVTEAQRLAA